MGARRVARWLLVEFPVRFFLAAESNGGSLPWPWFAAFAGVALAGGGIAASWGGLAGRDAGDAFAAGLLAGPIAMCMFIGYAVLFRAVLWLRGWSPEDVSTGSRPPAARGRHVHPQGRLPWRRGSLDGDAWLPVAAFFAIMAAMAGLDALLTHRGERRFAGPLAVTRAQVLRYDDGRFGLGHRLLVVQYEGPDGVVDGAVRADEVGDEVDRIPDLGGSLAVEYLVERPTVVRPAGTARRKAESVDESITIGGACAVLAVIGGSTYVITRRRRQR